MNAILNVVRRMDAKVDKMRAEIREMPNSQLSSSQNHSKIPESPYHEQAGRVSSSHIPPTPSSFTENGTRAADSPRVSRKGDRIPFSQHAMLSWPIIQSQIPQHLTSRVPSSGPGYAVDLEMGRPSLHIDGQGDRWLESLPVSLLTGLSEAFFTTFNPNTPVIERGLYFSDILSVVLREGFGYNAECCIVLNVLALGCLAIKAHEEGNFPIGPTSKSSWERSSTDQSFTTPEWIDIVAEDLPGLRFFNEARRRSGMISCNIDIYAGQYFLLSA